MIALNNCACYTKRLKRWERFLLPHGFPAACLSFDRECLVEIREDFHPAKYGSIIN